MKMQDRQFHGRSYPQPFLINEPHAQKHPSRAFVADGKRARVHLFMDYG
jgi:hypothetical protein